MNEGTSRSGQALVGAVLLIGVVLGGTLHFLDVEIAPHGVALVWIVCSAPLLYVTRAPAVAVVVAYQVCLWLALFVFRGLAFDDVVDRLPFVPALALAAGLALFAIGGTHYRLKALSEVARAIRIVGLKLSCLALVFLSVDQLASASASAVSWRSLGAGVVLLRHRDFGTVGGMNSDLGRVGLGRPRPACRVLLEQVRAAGRVGAGGASVGTVGAG